ncbi:MAG: recombinase family protein, partial [Candidatus Peregrinibacteria bacterium]|nr:recombinase family protein [Candidatus Peregrinibacteria bacterium]
NLTWMLQTEKIKEIVTPDKTFLPTENTLILSIEFGMATQFSRDLIKSVNRGMQSKIDKGWAPTKAPIGYMNEKHANKGEKRILPDHPNFKIVQNLWHVLLEKKYTFMELFRYMEKNTPLFQKDGRPVSIATFYRIFENKFYCGLFKWRGKYLVGSHEPMITQRQFEEAQRLLKTERVDVRHRDLIFEYKGIFKCGCCNAYITAEEHEKYIKAIGKKKKYRYYRCVHRKRAVECNEKPLSEIKVIKTIKKELEKIEIPKEVFDFGFKKLKEMKASKNESLKEVQLKKEITRLKEKLKLLKLNICEETDQEVRTIMKERVNEVKIQLRRADEDLRETLRTKNDPHKEIRTSLEVIKTAQEFLKNGSMEKKREIVKTLGSNWVLESQKLDYKPTRVISALQETKIFLLGAESRIEPKKNQSRNDLVIDSLGVDFIWSA